MEAVPDVCYVLDARFCVALFDLLLFPEVMQRSTHKRRRKQETLLNTKQGTFLPAFLPGFHEYKVKVLFIRGFMYYTEVHGRRWYHAMKTLLVILVFFLNDHHLRCVLELQVAMCLSKCK